MVKLSTGYRVIPLHPALKSVLRPLALKEGRCFDTTNQRKQIERICRMSGVRNVRWKALRHTFASHLAMSGVDLVTIKEYMGHANISTTMIYAHLTEGHTREQIKKLTY